MSAAVQSVGGGAPRPRAAERAWARSEHGLGGHRRASAGLEEPPTRGGGSFQAQARCEATGGSRCPPLIILERGAVRPVRGTTEPAVMLHAPGIVPVALVGVRRLTARSDKPEEQRVHGQHWLR
jgi:hypothetical protein